jgi:hypothetical protein
MNAPADDEAALLLEYLMAPSGSRYTAATDERERYATALRLQLPTTHRLDRVVHAHPLLLGGLDALSRLLYPRSILQLKLLVAAAVIECHPVSAAWLLPRDRGLFGWVFQILRLGLRAAGKTLLGLALLPLRGFLRRNVGPI